MCKIIVFFLIFTSNAFAQISVDSLLVNSIKKRLPENWQVNFERNELTIHSIYENGAYAYGCCPSNVKIPKGKKLLKWLKNDNIEERTNEIRRISDTLKIVISFEPTWSKQKIDSLIMRANSFNNEKSEKCTSIYWTSTSNKQQIPYYSPKLNSFVFFERPQAFNGIYTVEYEYGIPHLVSLENEILFIQQLVAVLLEIEESCFSCNCKK